MYEDTTRDVFEKESQMFICDEKTKRQTFVMSQNNIMVASSAT